MEYQWVRSNRKTTAIQIDENGDVIVRSPYSVSRQRVEKMLLDKQDWIEKHQKEIKERKKNRHIITEQERREGIERAKIVFPERIRYYAKIMGVTYGKVTLREQKTRWGSCSSKGNLNFNCLLMLTPPEIIDYVVVHELCHRKEMNHSENFWNEVEKVIPDYKDSLQWLKNEGWKIMRRQ